MTGADFVSIRKGKGRVHLAVGVSPGLPVETLCDKEFAPDDVQTVDLEADCQACLRRQADPGRVSSAFFQGGRGGALLELSLQQARERRRDGEPVREPSPSPRRAAPHLTIVPSERAEPVARKAAPETPPPPKPTSVPEPDATDLAPGVYRTPAGTVIRVGPRTEKPRLERRRGDLVRMLGGDVIVDVPPGDEA